MTPSVLRLVQEFEGAAEAAREAETLLRRSMAEEIARAERHRAFAFRRTRLVRLLASGAAGAESEQAALAAQAHAVAAELALSVANPAHKELLARLEPVGKAVWQCACAADERMDAAATNAALQDFETWFESARGQSFYMLFERHVPATPVVDF